MDTPLLRLRRRRRYHAAELREALVRGPDRGAGTSDRPSLAAVFRAALGREAARGIRAHGERLHLPRLRARAARDRMDGGGRAPPRGPRLSPRTLPALRRERDRRLFLLVRALAGFLGGAGPLRSRV